MAQERFLDPALPDLIAQWRDYLRARRPWPGNAILDIGCHSGDAERLLVREYPGIAKVIGIDVYTAYYFESQDGPRQQVLSLERAPAR
jgi:ubiquinone/menaquinone biosynthesis C-methylase UbiE